MLRSPADSALRTTTCGAGDFFSRIKEATHPNEIASETHRIPRVSPAGGARKPKPGSRGDRPRAARTWRLAGQHEVAVLGHGSAAPDQSQTDKPPSSSSRPLAPVAARREAGLKTGGAGRRDRGGRGRFGEGRRNGAGGRGRRRAGKIYWPRARGGGGDGRGASDRTQWV